LKNINPLKLCELGFSRVLMAMGIFILATDASLPPGDVISQCDMMGHGYPITLSKLPCFQFSFELRYERLAVCQMTLKGRQRARDVTSPGVNDSSVAKMSMPIDIDISTLENHNPQSFRGLIF
ncbi:hypothetical protein PRIPAC_84834, partial [Pristionchus pacificus]|uniref:Uncharacterized protein n=1 Tax=Pristionchus pacificus TaxID=54126 RepID=A0A2A6BTP2_PRIPA